MKVDEIKHRPTTCSNYIYHLLHHKTLSSWCVYVFHMVLWINRDYVCIQHQPFHPFKGGDVFSVRRKSISLILLKDHHGMTEAVRFRPLAEEFLSRSQASRCEICGGKSDTGTGFSPSTLVFPSRYHSTNIPYCLSVTDTVPTTYWSVTTSSGFREWEAVPKMYKTWFRTSTKTHSIHITTSIHPGVAEDWRYVVCLPNSHSRYKGRWENGGVSSHRLYFGTRWRWEDSFTSR
jgi:hypothetical protein